MNDTPICFSYDGLEMYISSDRPGGQGGWDLWVLRRGTTDDDWAPPENLGPVVNSTKNDEAGSISVDGLTLYFSSARSDNQGRHDIYMTTRTSLNDPWGEPVNLGPNINSSAGDGSPCISADGLELYFNSGRPDGYGNGDIYVARRATQNEPWGESVNLGPIVNSAYTEAGPHLSPDGLLLFFSDNFLYSGPRPGGYGGDDMWMTRRASLSDTWQPPVNLGPRINSSINELIPRIWPNGSRLYFTTNTDNTWENWQAPIMPICDFNSDGVVDIADVLIMVEHWHTDYSLCDIGPFPWGDGFVDAQDLMALAEHLYEEENPPTQ